MFIQEVNVKQRISSLDMSIQACLIDQKIRYVHPIMLWKVNNNLKVFIQACERKQKIVVLFVIHTIAKKKQNI